MSRWILALPLTGAADASVEFPVYGVAGLDIGPFEWVLADTPTHMPRLLKVERGSCRRVLPTTLEVDAYDGRS